MQVLAVVVQAGRPVSEVGRCFEPLPQTLRSIGYNGSAVLESAPVQQAIEAGEAALGAAGRLFIRKSGTEPKVRVMAEGDDETLVARVVDDIVAVIAAEAG